MVACSSGYKRELIDSARRPGVHEPQRFYPTASFTTTNKKKNENESCWLHSCEIMVAASSSTDNPQAGAGRPLPKKEADAFRNVVKHYEMKQYKKAIKQADSILKRFPNHGETLAMKGLTLNYMGSGGGGASNKEADTKRKEEAHALVKEGLRNDMRYDTETAALEICRALELCLSFSLTLLDYVSFIR